MPIPVYLFLGFLESGKTRFMQSALEDDRFQNDRDRSLVILCEEGEEELDLSRIRGGVRVETLTDKAQLNYRTLEDLQKRSRAKRIIIEYNGMWLLSDLQNALPRSWQIYQVMMTADASTIGLYDGNMRQLVADKLSATEMVAFNRCTPATDKEALHRLVRAVNRRADILYEYEGGQTEVDDIVDPLPFDRDAAELTVSDEDFGLLYMDMMDDPAVYDGKTLHVKLLAARSPKLPAGQFIGGRFAMTCCAADASLIGFPCVGAPGAKPPADRTYYTVSATVRSEKHAVYEDFGPVLYVQSLEEADKPADEMVYFR